MPGRRRSSKTPQSRTGARRDPLGREAWLRAARDALIRDGIAGVEIGRLARELGVTRGGFYWFFEGRRQLLDELLADWEHGNNAAFLRFMEGTLAAADDELREITDAWISEREYSPRWDAAVRDWARTSVKAANAVRRVDDLRIAILQRIFARMGHPEDDAFVRARITYFHQVGYYALGVRETREARLRLLPLYLEVLTGR